MVANLQASPESILLTQVLNYRLKSKSSLLWFFNSL